MAEKSKLNEEWHLKHKMPENPSFEQRLEWHREHVKHCGCRKPEGLIKEALDRGQTQKNKKRK